MDTQHRNFNDCYAFGRIAESQIAQWLVRAQHWHLLPAYEIEIPSGKGPRLLTEQGELISPDLLGTKLKEAQLLMRWIEAKHKSRFTWHRSSKNWQTGIDLSHYRDYIEVQRRTRIEVFILFLHRCSEPSQSDLKYGSPAECPTGLFCRSLYYLKRHEDHRDSFDKGRREYPMVYWNHKDLVRLATLEEVELACNQYHAESA